VITARARHRLGALASVVALVVVLTAMLVACSGDDGGATGDTAGGVPTFPATRPAQAPFEGFEEATLTIGDEMLQVLVAVTDAQRSQGLRGVDDLGEYAGMAFVYPQATDVAFTMAGVPIPLEVGFYDGAGALVDHLELEPCEGTDAECPAYRSSVPFVVAFEAPAGELPPGDLHR